MELRSLVFREKFDGNLFGINCNLKGEALWQTERQKKHRNVYKFSENSFNDLFIYFYFVNC